VKVITGALIFFMASLAGQANCLPASEVTLWQQLSYNHKDSALWRIDNKKAYTSDNGYHQMAIGLSNVCPLIAEKLDLSFSAYGFIYSSWQETGRFETDRHPSRLLINQISLAYNIDEHFSLEGGKIPPSPGAFFLKSPAKLLHTSYAGFKPDRLYDTAIRPVYEESYWGGRLSAATGAYALSFTMAAKLAKIDERYETTGNWPAAQRSNARERYLLSWTDYRQTRHLPSVHLLAGDSPAIALADSYNATSALMLNAELALHRKQQWRHFSPSRAAKVRAYDFTPTLYGEKQKSGIELALGGQYTTESLSLCGFEYYFQSEGYTESDWRQQIDFIKYLNTRTFNGALDQAHDEYKYLMAGEISNTINQGMLQKKHYIHSYANFVLNNKSTFQPWLILNMQDNSFMLGIHAQAPLSKFDEQLEIWGGAWAAQGGKDSEFALFGETLNIYLGFKYFL